MASALSSKIAAMPWQVLAALVAVMPLGSVYVTKHFVGGPRAAATMGDMPLMTPPGAIGSAGAASIDGFDIIDAKQWASLRERAGTLMLEHSPIGSGMRRVSNERKVQPNIVRQSGSTQNQQVERFPSQSHLTSVMRIATKGPLTADIARANARAVVGGKLRKVGQEAAPGWIIELIDVASGTMRVRHTSGAEHTLTLRQAESEQRSSTSSARQTSDLPGPMTVDAPSAGATPPPPTQGPEPSLPQGP